MIEPIHDDKVRELEVRANTIREDIISMLLEAKSGHSAGPLGMTDIFTALYFHVLKHNPKDPDWPERDRLVLSNGHICPVLYATMAEAGYFPKSELKTLRKIDSRLSGHPHRGLLPGLETSSGPLGEGISQSCGMALAARLDGAKWRVYCLTSDGEHQEGNTWEALMFASQYKLNNITLIMDRNNIQIDGTTEDIMSLEPLRQKYESFGWHVLEIDGHNIRDFVDAVRHAESITEQPTAIIAHTTPGKGVSFMEGDYKWHGMPPDLKQAKEALRELRTLGGKIESENE